MVRRSRQAKVTGAERSSAEPRRRLSGTLFGLALIFGTVAWLAVAGPPHSLTPTRLWLSDAMKWAEATVLLLVVVFWERLPLRSIGFRRPGWRDWALIPLVVIAALIAERFIGQPILHALGARANLSALDFIHMLPWYQKVSIVVAAGVTEEVMYRGFAIERLEALSGSAWLAVLLTTGFFVGAHIPAWGWATGIQQTLITLILAGAYVWRRNIVVPIGAHLIIDALGIFL